MNSPLLIWGVILLVVFGIYALYRKGKSALIKQLADQRGTIFQIVCCR